MRKVCLSIFTVAVVALAAIGAMACGQKATGQASAAEVKAEDATTVNFDKKMTEYGLTDIQKLDPSIMIDMRYATSNNFTGTLLYGTLNRVYVTDKMGEMLLKVQQELKKRDPKLGLVIFDCARPLSVQKHMWDVVKGTKNEIYVAKVVPGRGGGHNYGTAVDLSLVYDGKPMDMGTDFDCFDKRAHINAEKQLVKEGKISKEAFKNRLLLREVMTKQGFLTLNEEWWHFYCVSMKEARSKFKLLDF